MDTGSSNIMVDGTSMPSIPSSPAWTPRISPEAFVALQFTMMGLAIITASARTFLRVRKFRRVTLDDALLAAAVCFHIIAVVVSYEVTNLVYWTTFSNLRLVQPVRDMASLLHVFSVMDNISDIFGWGAIFIVKISFLVFLRQLVARVRLINIWWWAVFCIVIGSTPVTMFLGFYICPYFGPDMMGTLRAWFLHIGQLANALIEKCGEQVVPRQIIFLTVNCVLDIVSDTLILSIPCWLLWKVQIGVQRKLALGTILCLSIFMVIIAVLRVALDPIQLENGMTGPDTPWLYFWTNIEGSVAIIMVSLTAFRSMLGQDSTSQKGTSGSDPWSSDASRTSKSARFSPGPNHWTAGTYQLTRPFSNDSAQERLAPSTLPPNAVDHRGMHEFAHTV